MLIPLNLSIAGKIFHLLDFESINRTLYSLSIIYSSSISKSTKSLIGITLKQGVLTFHSTKP